MSDSGPIEVARVLASEYGDVLEPVNYVRGVALSGRLRLQRVDAAAPDRVPSVVEVVSPFMSVGDLDALDHADGSVRAGYLWADELTAATGDTRYGSALESIAARYLEPRADGRPTAVDEDFRVEDIFFAGTVLGRAYGSSGDKRYAEALFAFLERVDAQPDTGLWHHCGASQFAWGRGNAFAALGFAEALSYLPAADPRYQAVLRKHRAHLDALNAHQDGSGAWRQVIDRPDSYLELTATAMIGYSLARGLNRAWLPGDLRPPTEHAWNAVAERIDGAGMVRDSCPGTGPLRTIEDYLTREPISGHDDRAGSMALWFAIEYAELVGAS